MYTEYDWTTGDVLTAARMDNLEQQWQEATQETTTAPTISSGTLTLDLSGSNFFAVSLNANITTLTISNPPSSGRIGQFTLELTGDGTQRTITWPAAVKWDGAVAPTPTATSGKKDVYTFYTRDGGTRYEAFIAGQNK